MKSWIPATLCGLVLSSLLGATPAAAAPASKHAKHRAGTVTTTVPVYVSFSPREVQVIREYYAPQYRRLPPGLQKKLWRTGTLPPGWQKKFQPFPVVVERQLIVLPGGYRRGLIGRDAVIFDPRTHVVVDIAVIR